MMASKKPEKSGRVQSVAMSESIGSTRNYASPQPTIYASEAMRDTGPAVTWLYLWRRS